jgi:hypothetical protein
VPCRSFGICRSMVPTRVSQGQVPICV